MSASNLKKLHGSMNTLFSNSSTSLKSKIFEKDKSSKEDSFLNVIPSIYKLLDRSPYSIPNENQNLQKQIRTVALRILWCMKSKKDVKQEFLLARTHYGNDFISELLVYILGLDNIELHKRGLNIYEVCGKLVRYVANSLLESTPTDEPLPPLIYFPAKFDQSLNDFPVQLNASIFQEQIITPKAAKRSKDFATLIRVPLKKKLRQLRNRRKVCHPITSYAKPSYVKSTNFIRNTIQEFAYGYYIVQPQPTCRNNEKDNIISRLFWYFNTKSKHRDWYMENELQAAYNEGNLELLQDLLWHIFQLDYNQFSDDGINVDYISGTIVNYIFKELSDVNTVNFINQGAKLRAYYEIDSAIDLRLQPGKRPLNLSISEMTKGEDYLDSPIVLNRAFSTAKRRSKKFVF